MNTHLLSFILLILLFLDFLQTVQISRQPNRYFELNPILGKHPNITSVSAWFGFIALVVIVVMIFLSGLVVNTILVISIIGELVCIVNNWRIGIRFS